MTPSTLAYASLLMGKKVIGVKTQKEINLVVSKSKPNSVSSPSPSKTAIATLLEKKKRSKRLLFQK
jgi:hypothetical protein